MMTTNKESHSGVQYKGIIWFNTCDNSEKWLKSIYKYDIGLKKKEQTNNPIITKLIIDGKRV